MQQGGKAADALGRILEGGVVAVDEDLGDDGGDGLVDAAAAFLDLARIEPSGRLADAADRLDLAPPVRITLLV